MTDKYKSETLDRVIEVIIKQHRKDTIIRSNGYWRKYIDNISKQFHYNSKEVTIAVYNIAKYIRYIENPRFYSDAYVNEILTFLKILSLFTSSSVSGKCKGIVYGYTVSDIINHKEVSNSNKMFIDGMFNKYIGKCNIEKIKEYELGIDMHVFECEEVGREMPYSFDSLKTALYKITTILTSPRTSQAHKEEVYDIIRKYIYTDLTRLNDPYLDIILKHFIGYRDVPITGFNNPTIDTRISQFRWSHKNINK